MKILILGAKGMLGREFLRVLRKQDVVGWDRDELDITDETAVSAKLSDLKPDLVINCSAYNAVDKAEEDRQTAESVNGQAVGYLAKVCASLDIPLVHFSSNYVFDGNNPEGYNEDDTPRPLSNYGQSKLQGEIELQRNTEKYYLIRSAWLFGKPGGGKKSFVDLMLDVGSKGQPIDAIEDEFGNPTYVKDLAGAVVALVETKKPFGIYHLVNTGSCSWYDLAKEIFIIKNIVVQLNSIRVEEYMKKRKAPRPKFGVLNNTKFIQLRPWTEALKEYLESKK